jgi:hypothetical protein
LVIRSAAAAARLFIDIFDLILNNQHVVAGLIFPVNLRRRAMARLRCFTLVLLVVFLAVGCKGGNRRGHPGGAGQGKNVSGPALPRLNRELSAAGKEFNLAVGALRKKDQHVANLLDQRASLWERRQEVLEGKLLARGGEGAKVVERRRDIQARLNSLAVETQAAPKKEQGALLKQQQALREQLKPVLAELEKLFEQLTGDPEVAQLNQEIIVKAQNITDQLVDIAAEGSGRPAALAAKIMDLRAKIAAAKKAAPVKQK